MAVGDNTCRNGRRAAPRHSITACIWKARQVSPQSRRVILRGRATTGTPGRRSGRRPGSRRAPPNALFAEMLRAARELLAVRSPLDAELMVSELLGTWWGQRAARPAAARDQAPPRRHRGAGRRGTGRLRGRAGQPRRPGAAVRHRLPGHPAAGAQAEQAALELMERGVARPGWAEHVGAVEAAECYVNSDAYGDRDEVVCVFSYAGPGAARAGRGGRLQHGRPGPRRLGHLPGRQAAGVLRAGSSPMFTQVAPPQARRLLATALAATENAADPAVSSSFPSYHAFIRARVRTLPPRRCPRARPQPAARPRPAGKGGAVPPAPGVAQGPAGHAGRRVPGLRRGRGPVRPRGRQPLRRPHRGVRLRAGLRPAAADEPGQGRDVPARLAAAQGHAVPLRAGRDAARAAGLGALGGVARGPGRRRDRRHAGRGVRRHGRVHPRVPRPGLVRPGAGAGGPAAARRRPGGAGPPGVRLRRAARHLPRHRPGHAGPGPARRPAHPAGRRPRGPVGPPAATSTWTGTWRWPTGCGATIRRSCGRPRSACSTWARTGTRCCTR